VSTSTPSPTRTLRRGRWLVAAIVAALTTAYACIPRHADLAAFDADRMAGLEMLMWRHYYEKRYVALLIDLYAVARNEYGFSPLDSVRISAAAAEAAKAFQPSTSRDEAEVALPALVTYFRIIARGTNVTFDVEAAARTELAWWQARREAAGPEQYGAIIARVTTLIYGLDSDDLRQSGVVRARAMEYRDAHSTNTTEDDWSAIDDQLRQAYGLLKRAVASGRR
jgi:hypothetical protein